MNMSNTITQIKKIYSELQVRNKHSAKNSQGLICICKNKEDSRGQVTQLTKNMHSHN